MQWNIKEQFLIKIRQLNAQCYFFVAKSHATIKFPFLKILNERVGCLDMIMYWWICESIGIIFRDKQLARKRVIWANHFLLANALFTGEKLDFKELILNLFKLSWKSFAFDCFCLSTMNWSEKKPLLYNIFTSHFSNILFLLFKRAGYFFFCFLGGFFLVFFKISVFFTQFFLYNKIKYI